MEFFASEEHDELRQSIRRFLEDKSPSAEVRRLMETTEGYDPAVWAQMGNQLGLQALAIPEEYGGAGFSFLEQVVALEEMGRALLCSPYFASAVLAANAILTSGDIDMKKELLPGIASGETIATLALTESDGRWDLDGVRLNGQETANGWVLDGHKMFVLDGHIADLVLVVGRTPAGLALFAVDKDTSGLVRTALPTLDQTRKLARLEFDHTPARLIGTAGEAATGLAKTLDLAVVALAAEQLGGAQACLDMTVEYAKIRYQFGRPIGSFQAIKHRCADLLLEIDSARSAVYYASWVAAEDSPELPAAASLAGSYCSQAYFHTAAETIQMHGGIGFTWEHDAHLYFKRAKSAEAFLGDPAYHREQLVQRIGV